MTKLLTTEKQNSKISEAGSTENDNDDDHEAEQKSFEEPPKPMISKKNKKRKRHRKNKTMAVQEPDAEEIPEEIVVENDDFEKKDLIYDNPSREDLANVIVKSTENEMKQLEIVPDRETETMQNSHLMVISQEIQEQIQKEPATKSTKKKKNKSKKKKDDIMNPDILSSFGSIRRNEIGVSQDEAVFESSQLESIFPSTNLYQADATKNPEKQKIKEEALYDINLFMETYYQIWDTTNYFVGKLQIDESRLNSDSTKGKPPEDESILDKKNVPELKEEIKSVPQIITNNKAATSSVQNASLSTNPSVPNQTRNMPVATINEDLMARKLKKKGKKSKKKAKKPEETPASDKEILSNESIQKLLKLTNYFHLQEQYSYDDDYDNFANVKLGDF